MPSPQRNNRRRWVACALAVTACAADPVSGAPGVYQSEGTRKMAERLEIIARDADPMRNPYLSGERADKLQEILRGAKRPAEILTLQARYAIELLQAGRTEAGIGELHKLLHFQNEWRDRIGGASQNEALIRAHLVVAYLRLGEQENCLTNHNSESCILPIRGGGIHKLPRGSRLALGVLEQQLADAPEDLRARWLLNIAHMTLGEYPDKVPAPWLIPPSVFASDYDIKRFTDVAGGLGLDVNELSGGAILEDFDADGDLDLVASSLGLRHQLRYFRNNADGTFTDRTQESGFVGETGGLNIMQTDYNNDGYPDVWVLRGGWFGAGGNHPNSLLRNNRNGTFDDVTEETGLFSLHPTQTASWFDFDNDGWLDVFIGNESTNSVHPCELFRNNRNGTFTECAAEAGVAVTAWVKGVGSGDFNNDGRPDLYLSCLGESNRLLRNDGPVDPANPRGPWRFTDVTEAAGVSEPRYSFPTWFWDYDHDGWLDIFVSGFRIRNVGEVAADYLGLEHQAERPRLYRNRGNGTFADVTQEVRLYKALVAMGSNFGDLDNDGFLDFYLGTGDPDLATLIPNRMFRNADGKYFQDVTTSGGFGHLQKGHGIAFGDIDNDGDQDIYEVMGGAFSGDVYRNVLLENPGHDHHWIKLKLVGVKSNRVAIGARLRLTLEENGKNREIHRTVGSGGSFGASPLRQEIGVGKATRIKQLEIFWPVTGRRQLVTGLALDRSYEIEEDNPKPKLVEFKPFTLARGGRHQHKH